MKTTFPPKSLLSLLERLDLISINQDDEIVLKNGVLFKGQYDQLSSEEELQLNKVEPDALYHFDKQPLILFFDLTNYTDIDKQQLKIHRKTYSYDKPVIFIINQHEINIYNAFAYDKKQKRLEKINSKHIHQFKFWKLHSGQTWEWFNNNIFNRPNNTKKYRTKRVHEELLNNIKKLRDLLSNTYSDAEDVNFLILRIIFIRYLIDRQVEITQFFPDTVSWEAKKQRLNDIIRNKDELNSLFRYLQKHFKGSLFKKDIPLYDKALNTLSSMFSGQILKTGDVQFNLFDTIDFGIIPIETISGIYESILSDEDRVADSAVYTPLFLANYVLDKTLNQKYFNENGVHCKILDPACGSGIFLVQALRRMVFYTQKSKLREIDIEYLDKLVRGNIYGIDRNPLALQVATFSIYIAMLDFLTPVEIEDFAKDDSTILPELIGKNLFNDDFFNLEDASFNDTFGVGAGGLFQKQKTKVSLDFIIGNPPWGNKSDAKHLNYIKKVKNEIQISDNQIAQSFMWRVKDFINRENTTQIILIITSKALYNLKAQNFRKTFFSSFKVDWLLDMSAARRIIFQKGINPAIAIQYHKASSLEEAKNHRVKYEALKPNIFTAHFQKIVLDTTEIVKQSYFIAHDYTLKVLLYGNISDFYLLNRLKEDHKRIQKVIDSNNKVYTGDGIKSLTDNAREKLNKLPKNRVKPQSSSLKPFEEIREIPLVKTTEMELYYTKINQGNLPNQTDLYVKTGRNINLYQGERILLKGRPKDETVIFISYVDTSAVYPEKTLGITSQEDTNFLKKLYGIFISKLYTYYEYLISSSWGIFLPDIRHQEFLDFPYSDAVDQQCLVSYSNKIIEAFQHSRTQGYQTLEKYQSKINQLIHKAYHITDKEKALIDYILEVARYEFKMNEVGKYVTKQLNQQEDENYLHNYARVFYNHFSEIYDGTYDEFFQIKIYIFDYFIAMQFCVIDKPPFKPIICNQNSDDEIAQFLGTISSLASIVEFSEELFIQKSVKGFEEYFFYIIKPNQRKSWHRAKAYEDCRYFIDEIDKIEAEELLAYHE